MKTNHKHMTLIKVLYMRKLNHEFFIMSPTTMSKHAPDVSGFFTVSFHTCTIIELIY